MKLLRAKSGLPGKIFRAAVFLFLCLGLGFFAERMIYRSTRSATIGIPENAHRIAMIGGSVIAGISPRELEQALERKLPSKKFFVHLESSSDFKLRHLRSVHDRVSEMIKPELILVQVGCSEISELPKPDGPIARLKELFWEWKSAVLNDINTDFLYRYGQFQADEEGLRKNEIRYAKLIADAAMNVEWATIHQFNLNMVRAPRPAEGGLLTFPVLQAEVRVQLNKLIEAGLENYDQRRTFLYLLDTTRILNQAHEAGAKRKPKRSYFRTLNVSNEYEQLERLGERFESGWKEISQSGCGPYINGGPQELIWERYWICYKWMVARHSSPSAEINLSHPGDPLPPLHFLRIERELDPDLIQNKTGRLIAFLLNESKRQENKPIIASPERIEMNQKKSLLDGVFGRQPPGEFLKFVETARERGESAWLVHYPETHYLGIEKLAEQTGLRTVRSKGIFTEKITPENYSAYFTDSADCGMGHVSALGGDLWTKHVAEEVSAFFRDKPARN